jgi:hypothetical protein
MKKEPNLNPNCSFATINEEHWMRK